jgi:hypothetical protein
MARSPDGAPGNAAARQLPAAIEIEGFLRFFR